MPPSIKMRMMKVSVKNARIIRDFYGCIYSFSSINQFFKKIKSNDREPKLREYLPQSHWHFRFWRIWRAWPAQTDPQLEAILTRGTTPPRQPHEIHRDLHYHHFVQNDVRFSIYKEFEDAHQTLARILTIHLHGWKIDNFMKSLRKRLKRGKLVNKLLI